MSALSPAYFHRFIRPHDAVWLILFSALAVVSPYRSLVEVGLIVCLGLFQVAEPRLRYFTGQSGTLTAILIKLALCYLLVGWTGGINSTYYLIFLLPVVSAATALSLIGTVGIVAFACLAYLSFLFFLDWNRFEMPAYAASELALRVLFLPVVGFLTHQLAEANRVEARKYQAVAEQLSAANASLREAEAAVRRSDRLAALGQLTAGLAHEVRNPLGTIRASAEMLMKNVAANGGVSRELADFIASEADRTNSLITRFLEFARPTQLRLRRVELTSVIDRAAAELERLSPPLGVTVYRSFSPEIGALAMDEELMQRVFYNLILNAAQATPQGGAVTVKTRAAGPEVEISVIDRGAGIEKRHLENIFNPFFTTKPRGVGLGLAIVSKIVDEHGGKIAVDSVPGEGTIFRVYLSGGAAASREQV